MAADKTTNKDFTIRRHNGESYDALLPTTHMGQVYTDSTLVTTLDEHLTNVYAPITAITELEDKKADKTALAVTNQNIVNLQNDKADKTDLTDTTTTLNGRLTDLENDKVNKTQTIMGLDFHDNITRTEVVDALGEATQILSGLMSITDKQRLDALHAMLGVTEDADNVVNTINEIMEIFATYPEGADILTTLNDKANKTDVYTKPETYTQEEINALLDNLGAVKGLKSTLLTPTELENGDTISTNLLTNNGAYVVFTATDTSTGEIDSDTVPISTIKTGKKFVFFDNQEIVFTIGETNSTFETSEDVTLKINLLYLDDENVQAISVDFDGSLTNYLLNQENVQSAIRKLDEELKTTNDGKVDKITGKGLSTEDYTTTEKNKLSGIEAGAEVNVQSDWTQEVNTADDYIKNKPAIPTKTSDLTNDTGYIDTETDPIFTAWNKSTGISITKSQISDLIEATQSLSGLMSATDKQRLDALHALLEEDTSNNVVDSINEVLAIFNNYPEGADLVSALAGKVDKNNAITAGTKTKITYDSKGLVTGGSDLVATDIPALEISKITGLQTALDGKVDKNSGIGVENWSGASWTPGIGAANKLFICSYAGDQTVILPNDSVSFPIGTIITFLLTSTYKVTFTAGSGANITSMNGIGSVELATQYAMASAIKADTNTWQLVGALE